MISTWGVWTRDTGATLPVWPDSASSMEDKSHTVGTFQVGDYVVFALLFVVSSGIGVFFAIKERKKALSKEFLVGGRQMSCGPVALSLTASFMSAVTVIGAPSDVYRYGASYVIFGVAYTFVVFFTAELFLPVFYRSGITSTYEVRIRIFQICFVIKVGFTKLLYYRHIKIINITHIQWTEMTFFGGHDFRNKPHRPLIQICSDWFFSQYLELRFCKLVRVAATLIYIIQTVSGIECSNTYLIVCCLVFVQP